MPYVEEILPNNPSYLQTKSYDAKADRQTIGDIISPGVVGDDDFEVTWLSGMTVRIKSGIAYVPGLNETDQGIYRQSSESAVDMIVTAADATHPRVDQVILRIMDGAADSSAAYEGRLEIVPGTPTAGATLVNRSGVADLTALDEDSKNVLLLADVLVLAAAVALDANKIGDKRAVAKVGGAALGAASATTIGVYADLAGIDPTDVGEGSIFTATDTGGTWTSDGAAWILTAQKAVRILATDFATHPGPYNGQEIEIVDSLTAPTYHWVMRYNSSSSNSKKWEWIHGKPKIARATGNTTNSSTDSTWRDKDGPSFAIPIAGDYNLRAEIRAMTGTQTNAQTASMRIAKGAADGGATDISGTFSGMWKGPALGRTQLDSVALLATDTVKLQYHSGGSGVGGESSSWSNRALFIYPEAL